jgi:hypothetical protein
MRPSVVDIEPAGIDEGNRLAVGAEPTTGRGFALETAETLGFFGGEGGIRTLGTVTRTTVFETVPIDHSGTSPQKVVKLRRAEHTDGVAGSQGRG